MSKIKLGFFRKKIELDALKSGIQCNQLKNPKEITIFNQIDKNKDGTIDQEELKQYTDALENAAGKNGKLSRKELRNAGLGVNRKDVYKFLNSMTFLTPNMPVNTPNVPVDEAKPEPEVKPGSVDKKPIETPKVPVETEEPPKEEKQDYKHKLQAGDTWYGLVEAKYGTKDPAQIRAIIKEIKKINPDVDLMTAKASTEITFPQKITLADGQEYNLTEDEEVDAKHYKIKKDPVPPKNDDDDNTDAEETLLKSTLNNQPSPENVEIAKKMCKIIDDKSYAIDSEEFKAELKKVNENNVLDIVKAYKSEGVSPDESLFEAIYDEGNKSSTKKDAVQKLFKELENKAAAVGVNKSHIDEFKNNADDVLGKFVVSTEKLDAIADAFIQAIENKMQLTQEEKEKIKNTPQQELNADTNNLLNEVANNASKSFTDELDREGWAAWTAEGISNLWNSENTSGKVHEDLNAYRKNIADLEKAHNDGFKYDSKNGYTYDNTLYAAKFKEIFGVDYDPELVKAYEKKQETYLTVNAFNTVENKFNNDVKVLLASPELREETDTVCIDPSANIYQTNLIASKPQVYDREFNTFAEFIGNGDKAKGKEDLEKTLTEMGIDLKTATIDEKYAKLHEIAKKYSETLHNNTLQAGGGKEYGTIHKEYENSYAAAFGTKNDIMKRVNDYNVSQQTGEMVVKGVSKAGMAIGSVFIPGVGLAGAALLTTLSSTTVDLSDRVSSKIGLQDGELTEILKNAAIDGASVIAGGGMGKLVGSLKNAGSFVKIGGQMAGDIAIGASGEFAQTGEITIGGTAFQAIFSSAGGLLALRQLAKVAKNAHVPKSGSVVEPHVSKGVKGEVNNYRNPIKDAEITRNADQKHLNARERTMVEESLADIPTEAELQVYMKEHGYKAPAAEERAAIEINNKQAAEANAKAHEIGENLSPEEIAKLRGETPVTPVKPAASAEITGLQNEIKGLDGQIKRFEQQIAGAKKMGKDTKKLETTMEGLTKKRAAKTTELEALQKPSPAEVPVVHDYAMPEPLSSGNHDKLISFDDRVNMFVKDGYHIDVNLRKNGVLYINKDGVGHVFNLDSDGRIIREVIGDARQSGKVIQYSNTRKEIIYNKDGSRIEYDDVNYIKTEYSKDGKIKTQSSTKPEPEPVKKLTPEQIAEQKMRQKTYINKKVVEWHDRLMDARKNGDSNAIKRYEDVINENVKTYKSEYGEDLNVIELVRRRDEKQLNVYTKELADVRKKGGNKKYEQKLENLLNDSKKKFKENYNVEYKADVPSTTSHNAEVLETRYLTSEERMQMGQIGNNISRARSLKDLEAAQSWLNKMPDCDQKSIMQNRLNEKMKKISGDSSKTDNIPNEEGLIQHESGKTYSSIQTAGKTTMNAKAKSDINLTPGKNETAVIDPFARIRIADKVELDMSDFSSKLNAMKDGDSFIIGKNVSGANDIRIPNEVVSGQHIKVEKINGEIVVTNLSKTNGIEINSSKADYTAKYNPNELKNKYKQNMTMDEWESIHDIDYENLRESGHYSYEESIVGDFEAEILPPDRDLTYDNYDFKNGCWKFVDRRKDYFRDGWAWHEFENGFDKTKFGGTDRVSLNVKADGRMLDELDNLLLKGNYKDANGNIKSVSKKNFTKGMYKTDTEESNWVKRHDPVTLYFDDKLSDEMLDAISTISERYKRNSSKQLMNALDGKPWIAKEEYISPEQVESLLKKAAGLDKNLAEQIYKRSGSGDYNLSTGSYATFEKIIAEYEMFQNLN